MPALTRKHKKIFAKNAAINIDSGNVVFGSNAASAPVSSNDTETLESLAAFETGFSAATIAGTKLPVVGEVQALKYDTDYHLAYIYQDGLQNYNDETEYFIDNFVREGGTGKIWKSLVDDNVGNPLVEGVNWTLVIDMVGASNPVGTVIAFAANSPPIGYLEWNGAAVSRTTYSALFAVIGTTFGAGDGSTTFNLGDSRGQFIRGWDNGAGVDSGRVFGSTQNDAFQGHHHNLYSLSQVLVGGGGGALWQSGQVGTQFQGANCKESVTDGTNGTPRTASETRPKNIALMYCVKY